MNLEIMLRIKNKIIDISKIVKYGINSGKKKETSFTDKLFNLSLRSILISNKPTNKKGGPFLYICLRGEEPQINIYPDAETDIQKINDILDKLRTIGLIKIENQYSR